jgi:glycine/D-amino acid oxidase-like deaminating enzyme
MPAPDVVVIGGGIIGLSAPFTAAWAGLRPASADRLPLLGPLPGWGNVALATGHFRNGVLLAALTGSLLAEWVLCRRLPPLMAPFMPEQPGSGSIDRTRETPRHTTPAGTAETAFRG